MPASSTLDPDAHYGQQQDGPHRRRILTSAFQWGWGIDLLGIDTTSSGVPIARATSR